MLKEENNKEQIKMKKQDRILNILVYTTLYLILFTSIIGCITIFGWIFGWIF